MQDRTPRTQRRSPFLFLNLIGAGILIVTVVAAGGIFLLKSYTESSIASKKQSLDRQRAAFEPATIEELLRLDKRLNASSGLLKTHTALTLLFNDLETRTGENVRFKTFKYEPGGPNRFVVSMNGIAKSFNAVALQSDSLGKSNVMKDPIFSNLNLDQGGDVVFDFSADIDPARINYGSLVAGVGAAEQGLPVPDASSTQQ